MLEIPIAKALRGYELPPIPIVKALRGYELPPIAFRLASRGNEDPWLSIGDAIRAYIHPRAASLRVPLSVRG